MLTERLEPRSPHECFGGGVQGYRDFLRRTEGAADPVRFRLEHRELRYARMEEERRRSRYRPARDVFLRNVVRSAPEAGLDDRMTWLLATAKLNQAERFGVGLGELFGKDQWRFDSEPELLYVMLQEHYHTRLLAEVVSMFDLPMPTIPPQPAMRLTIAAFVALPHEWTLPAVCASEVVGCIAFRLLRDTGVALFSDEPEVAERIRALYDEIYADEIGHVGFLAAKMSRRMRSVTRWLAREVAWRPVVNTAPELTRLVGEEVFLNELRSTFDVERESRAFGGRAFGAASL